MPILDVEIVVKDKEATTAGLASAIADAAGEVFATQLGRTWVRMRTLPRDSYAENGGGPADGILPVFVTVLKAQKPDGTKLKEEIRQLTGQVARICGRPEENVHILYLPDAAGRIAFGGLLRE